MAPEYIRRLGIFRGFAKLVERNRIDGCAFGKDLDRHRKVLILCRSGPMVLAPEGRSSPRARQVPVDGAVVTPAEAVVVATPGPVVACVVAGCELATCTVAGAGF